VFHPVRALFATLLAMAAGACSGAAEPVGVAEAASTTCAPVSITGRFEASGNATPFAQIENPIVAVFANGAELHFFARNGEQGVLHVEGARAHGAFADTTGWHTVFLAPFTPGDNAPVSAIWLGGADGERHAITLEGAGASTRFGSFQFFPPIEFVPASYVTAVEGRGDVLELRDPFGATATVRLSCRRDGAP